MWIRQASSVNGGNRKMWWRWSPAPGASGRLWPWICWRSFFRSSMPAGRICLMGWLSGRKRSTAVCRGHIRYSWSALRMSKRTRLHRPEKPCAVFCGFYMINSVFCWKEICWVRVKRKISGRSLQRWKIMRRHFLWRCCHFISPAIMGRRWSSFWMSMILPCRKPI